MGSSPLPFTSALDIAPVSRKNFLDIQENIGCLFTRNGVCDMIITCTQMHRTDKYSNFSSIISSFWPNGWALVYGLSGCGFESHCSHLNLRYCTWLEQGVSWHSGEYRVWIQSAMRTWHERNIQSNAPYRQVLTIQLNQLVSFVTCLGFRLRNKWLWVRVPLQYLKL